MGTNHEDGVSLDDVSGLLGDEIDDERDEETGDEEQGDLPTDEPEEVEPEDDEEVEIEGKSYKVPKELKDMVLMHKDYTQKTQAVADQRRAVEERAHALEQREQLMSQTFEKAVEFREVQNRLAQYEQIDWQALAEQDPVQATKLNLAYQQLQRDAQAKYGALQQAHSQAEQLTQQQRQQLLAEAEKDLKARLPDFGPQVAEKIVRAAKDYGFTDGELEGLTDARHVHVLHDAMKWRALQAEKPKAMRAVAEAPRAIKPQSAQPKRTSQSAVDRLRKSGRVEDLARLL
ncbi:hypothetical protein [Pseudomonas sp.]|uniref:hypothetical protein n=1 Tax=Pseudomonas sp. TaxID=306 RepID=UPI00258B364E|nr:hypothetical protein [Pseudomonas sp.]